jgi:pimeloyl-ACP methyl ester carboxylesterase
VTSAPFHRGRYEDLPDAPRRPHGYMSAPRRTVHVRSQAFGQVDLNVVVLGSGPPLLLLHGLMTSGYSWRYVMGRLAEHFTLYIPDLPGAGHSQVVADREHSGAALATLIGELQAELGITGCAAVGNSLGGYVCMLRALQEPSSFSRLVVIHPPGVPQLRLHAVGFLLRLAPVRAGLSRVIARHPLRWAHRNVHYHDESLKSREEAREYGRPLRTAAGRAEFMRYLGEAVAPGEMARFVAALRRRREAGLKFPVPLLMIYADRDPLVDPGIGRRLHALIPDARLEWLPESSHFAHVDTPGRVAELVEGFVPAG